MEIRGCAEENADLPCFLPASNGEVRLSQPCRPAFALRRFAVWQGEGVVVKERGCGWSKEERPFQLLLPIRYRFIIEDRGEKQLCIRKMGSRFETTSTFAPRGEFADRRAGDRKRLLS